jgi:hypothetical protein
MSFAIKTRSQASSFREKHVDALARYSSQLEAYAKKYVATFDGNESISDWSSRHAQRFSTSINAYIPIAVITRDLGEYVITHKKSKAASAPSTQLTVTRYYNERSGAGERATNSLAERSQFNRLLLEEFDTWYSAFEAEAEEDFTNDAPSADSRWIYHCANKLHSRTGLSSSAIVPVIEAWLNEQHKL